MKNLNGWMFLIIALMWLLPLVGVSTGTGAGNWGTWIAVIALAVVGFMEVKGK
ncbi:MAG: hypothetical protein IIA87_00210 [Nanoarchaeota archaeon]|nr:hypothetical protein [Nanoarchaeota archaeon]